MFKLAGVIDYSSYQDTLYKTAAYKAALILQSKRPVSSTL